MKLSKATKELETFIPRQWWQEPFAVRDAIKLGLEALKARQRDRQHSYIDLDDLLPGETQEDDAT